MEATLRWEGEGLHFTVSAESGHTATYDSPIEVGGTDRAIRPMEGLLSAMLACFSADVVSILRKKRRQLLGFSLRAKATRRDDFPRVFTRVEIHLFVRSPDATTTDVERAIELSRTKYCSAMAMFEAAGCEIAVDFVLEST
ncbi:MAG: OsmC family protein [Bacteroidia bacterium]|nr:OsmC family protein [Bacteroidia bacterium]